MRYKVIFNRDPDNYEEFDNIESAERFAAQYMGTEIVSVPCEQGENELCEKGEFKKIESNADFNHC